LDGDERVFSGGSGGDLQTLLRLRDGLEVGGGMTWMVWPLRGVPMTLFSKRRSRS